MAAVIAAVDGAGHPLRGVIHAAMQLDDGQVPELGDERFRAVLAPKMQGGMVLDALTRDRPLDFFVAFSSMTALVGTLNQANYSAGNLFLEALMRARHHAGRPALAAAWAGISDIGYVARQGLRDSLTGLGLLFPHARAGVGCPRRAVGPAGHRGGGRWHGLGSTQRHVTPGEVAATG